MLEKLIRYLRIEDGLLFKYIILAMDSSCIVRHLYYKVLWTDIMVKQEDELISTWWITNARVSLSKAPVVLL